MSKDGGRLDGFFKYISDWEIIKRNEWLWNFLGYPLRRKPDPPVDLERLHEKMAEQSSKSSASQRIEQGIKEHVEWLEKFRQKSPFAD